MADSIVPEVPFSSYTANGVSTVYPYTFTLLSLGDLVVTDNGVVITSGFAVSNLGAQGGGNITFTVAPLSGHFLAFQRVLAARRDTDYQYNGDFQEQTVDRDFNRLWQFLQGVQYQFGSVIRLPYPEQTFTLPAAPFRLGTTLGFDAVTGAPVLVTPGSTSSTALALSLASISGAGLSGYNASNSYLNLTVGRELRRWLTLDHFVSNTTGTVDVAAGINAAIAAAVTLGSVGIYGSPTSTYLIQSKINLSTARNLVLDFRGATLIDDVRTIRADMSNRGDHAFLIYGNSGVEVCNLNYQIAATRQVTALDIPSIAFWIGGQNEGSALTKWASIRNITGTVSKVGMMFASVPGEASGVEISNITLTGRWSYGFNFEYGGLPGDPAVNNTITNGLHPFNAIVKNVVGVDLLDCLGFLRTASCYNVKFERCQGSNVRNFIYGYVGDRGISRFSQNVVFESCKSKIESSAALTAVNYDVQIIVANKDGSTGDPLPAWTNYRQMFRFSNCEFQSGMRTNNCAVRFYGSQGKVVFDQCIFRDTYYGVLTGPSSNPDYTSVGSLVFRDCLFVNNYQDVLQQTCDSVLYENCRFEAQNTTSTIAPLSIQNSASPAFSNCRFTGKSAAGPNYWLDISSCSEVKINNNHFQMLSIAHIAINNTTSPMKGSGNSTNGILTGTTLATYGIVGENRTMTRDLSGASGIVTFEKGCRFGVSTTENFARIIGGALGDEVVIRSDGSGAAVTFQHVFAGVPTLERIINNSATNDTVSGSNWSRRYMKFNDGWRQV